MNKKEFITLFGKSLGLWMQQYWLIVVFIIFLILQYIVSIYVKKWIKNKYKYTTENDPADESYIRYYQKLQLFEFIRIMLIVGGTLYTLAVYQSGFFSVFAVAIGTIIITFQTIILSFGVYFYLFTNYRAGDTIRVGDIGQGEIVYIKPLYMSISSKNNEGEHMGELLVIPNNQIRGQPITKVNLSLRAYTKQILTVVYDMKTMDVTFDQFVGLLEQFLNQHLPKISRKAYINFKTYSGLRYKLNYELGEYRDTRHLITIEIKFITPMADAALHKKSIISFVDSLLKPRSSLSYYNNLSHDAS